MHLKIYADEMILINIITNFIILTSTDIINRFKTVFLKRFIISAFVSSTYTAALAIDFNFFISHSYIFLVLMVILYSVPCRFYAIIKNYVIINILSCMSLGILKQFTFFNVLILILTLILTCIISRAFIYYISYRKYYNILIFNNNKKTSIKALLDSGNLLIDPMTKKPVIIAERNSIADLYENRQLRRVPYKSLGNENGEFYVFDAEKVRINNHNIRNPVIAVYNTRLSDDGKYNAIISLKHLGGN